MKFHLPQKASISSIIVLASLLTSIAQAAPLNLYNKDGRLFSDQELVKIQERMNKPLLIDTSLAKQANNKYFSVTLQTFTGLNSYSPDMVDITKSYLGVVIGNTRYNEFLSDFQEATTQNTVVQLSLRFSLIPLILSGTVKDSASSTINAKAEQARAQYTAAAAVSIHQQVQSMVSAGKLTAPQAEVMEAKFIGSAKLQIDSQVDLAKSRSISKINNKITKIEEEATFQEFAIRFGQKLFQNEKGALLIFGEIGKAPIEGNLTSATGLTGMTPMAWWAPRGLSVQGTGEVKLGLEWITTANAKVGFETYFFHDRAPVISGERFMTNLIYSSDESFEKQTEFWKINSDMEKFYVKIPSKFAQVEDQFYVTTASFDGKRGVAAGGIIRILPQVESTHSAGDIVSKKML